MNTCPTQKPKTPRIYFAILALVLLILSLPTQALAATGINKQINFQGKVVNTNGTNVANGNYDFEFKLYTVDTGGTAVWTETRNAANQVTVTDGIFRVSLGSITALPGSVDFNTDNIYLGVKFHTEVNEMTPRIQFAAVPYAFNALKVAGLTVTDTTGTFTLAAAKTLTVNNTLTFAGTDATTITFQGTDTYVGRATTDTLTNKTIGSTGLIFSGATTDITTAAGEALIITPNGAAALTLGTTGAGNTTSITLATDSTGDAEVVLPDNSIGTAEINDGADAPGDEECLTYELTGTVFEWQSCGAGGGGIATVRESDLSPSVGSLTTLEFGPATTSSDEFIVTDQTGGVARVVLGDKVVKTDATQNLTNKTYNGLTVTANGTNTLNIGAGFSLIVSTASKTLTGAGTQITIANSLDFGTGTTGTITLGSTTNTLSLATAGNTSLTLPTAGTLATLAGTETISNKTFNSDINFLDANPGMTYAVAGSDSTAVTVAGGDLTVRAGAGLTTGGGGNLILAGGTSPSGAAGYLAFQAAGGEKFRIQADGTFLFEKGTQDVILSVTAPATATRTYTIPDFGANDSFVGLAATQALTNKTYNGLTVTANGTNTLNIGAGLTLGVSTASKTLTGAGTTLTFAGDFTTAGAFATILTTSGTTSVTLPTSGTLLTNTAAAVQTVTSTQSTGTVLGITDATALTGAIKGAVITLSGINAQDQTGLEFNLSGATGTNLNDIVGSSSTWKVSKGGAATFVSTTSPTYTGAGAVTLSSGGSSGLTFDSASGDITVAANDGLTFAATTLGNNGSRNVTINSGTGGTTATLIVKLDTSGTVVTTDTTTLNNAVGVALNTTTAGQAVRVAINGVVTATADNAVTAGDYIGLGTTTAGRAKSLGTTYPSTAGVQVIGRALGSQATPGSTFLLMLNGLDNNVAAGGGGGYNLIKEETTSLTARTTLAFLGTAMTCADNAGLSQTECTISSTGGGVSFASGTPDNTTTSNNLIQLQKSGVNKFVVSNAGGLTINGTDSSIVRTLTSEFATGALLTNLTNANDQLELSDGTAGNGIITTAGQPVVNVAIGAGSHAITRADGKYQVIVGGGTALTTYDSIAGTFTASAQVLTGAAGAGALSLPRPDGRYRVIHGGGLTTTSLVDPNGVVAVGASVAVNASGNGTVAYRRANGQYLVTNGAAATATTQLYNPVTDAFAAGPTGAAGVWGIGALVLPRPNGQALIVQGGATATTALYNPDALVATAIPAGPVLPAGCEINNAGSIAIRKQDGKYLVLSKGGAGAAAVSTVYDPVANTFSACATSKGPTVALADGAHAIPMQDGKFLIIIGGASTVANIYDPSTDTFTAHATAITAGGAGRHSIMRANGTWQLIAGGGTATNNFNTALPMSGTYQSDDISTTSLNASSTLKWTAQYESPYTGTNAAANTAFSSMQFLVRTAVNTAGLAAAVDREIITPGDFIRPASTDVAIRMTVKFNRPLPKRIFDDRGTWMGNGNTVTRLDFATPTLFDIQVDNSTVLRRNNFAFTEPNAQTAAPQNETSGPVATRVEAQADRMYLPYGRMTPANQFLTGGLSSGLYPGVISGAHPNLPVTTTDGTVVIARPDRTFLVMSAAAANAAIYDPASSTFTAQAGAGNIPTAAVGAGAFALKRPDGKFLVVLGGAATTTNIYDPNAASGSRFVAGPALIAAAGSGAMAIQNTDGTFTIVHGGGATTSSIYDPVRNTMLTGPATPVATNCGAWAIPRPKQNQYLTFFGVAAGVIGITTTSTYDAQTKIFSPTAGSPTLPLAAGCGSFAFQRADGLWVYLAGGGGTAGAGQTAGGLYNPDQNIITALGLTFTAVQRGAHVIPRADGTFLIINGGALTTTNLYIPWGGAFLAAGGPAGSVIIGTAAPAPPVTQTAVGAGALSFQRPDGKWVIIVGGATASAVTNLYDAGWYPDGQYLSEQVQVPALAANSTLEWKQTPDNFVRMEIRVAASQAALGTAPYFTVGRPGQSIANAGGETWVQVEVNFRRDFPTFGNSLADVYVSTGGRAYPYRQISLPTVFEYKLNNGMDLLNLQANGLNMLRVTSNGNIYSSATGGFYSGGADLAENYTSVESLEEGEVVIMDTSGNQGVVRSNGQYQAGILGVVSTNPGFVAGSYTENSYPIALVGRVPVKVSTENGAIHAGDYLTSASIPGYAMKANMAGRVLGKAMEPFDSAQGKECPAFGMGNLPTTKCGEVMMFVNLTDYLGTPVEIVMTDRNTQKTQAFGLSESPNSGVSDISDFLISSGSPSSSGLPAGKAGFSENVSAKQQEILTFLRQLKDEQASASAGYHSEVFTDRVSAVKEVISPQIVTDILYAKKIKADSIEGLEILTDKISGLNKQVAGLSTQGQTASSSSLPEIASMSASPRNDAIVTLGNITIESAKVTLDFTVLGKLETQGGLIVGGPAEFKNDTIFNSLAQFISKVIFKSDVFFEGRPTFNKDTAGIAVIKKDADNVEVVFEKEYATAPIVSVNITFDPIKLTDGSVEDYKLLQKRISESGYSYFIANRSTRGFTVVLSKEAKEDLTFSWIALAVKDAKRFESNIKSTPTPSPLPDLPSPNPSSIPSSTPSPTPIATSSAGLTHVE